MVHAELQDRLRDVAAGILTPFDEDLEIDHGKLQENARHVYDEGIRLFLACANVSEYHALSNEERIAVTRSSADALPSDACILGGVGGSTRTATDLIAEYERIGVDAIMVMPPDHTYLHEDGLLTYYRKLSSFSDLGLVPYVRGFDPSVEFLTELTKIPGVAGIKYAIEKPLKLSAAAESGDDDVVWVNGLAEPLAPVFFHEGAEGFTAGVSNFEPRVGLELFDALGDGEWKYARELRDLAIPYQQFRGETDDEGTFPGAYSVSALKYGLDLAGLHGGRVREPIVELSEEDKRRAETYYEDLQENLDQVLAAH